MSHNRTTSWQNYPSAIARWLDFGRCHFSQLDSGDGLGHFGPAEAGDLAIEATALYAFTLGLAATDDAFDLDSCAQSRDQCLDDALAAFRWCLHTHAAHEGDIPDGPAWGGTGMSPKMADQLALSAEVLDGALEDGDRDRLARLIEYEADQNILLPYHLEHVDHGFYRKRPPVPTQRFGNSYPESNAWRACILARALLADPAHENAGEWRESMLTYFANALSVPADAEDETLYDGRPLREWHAGANLHPSFALEHHGFFHPGYVNRALLSLFSAYYAFEDAGEAPPDLLMLHVPEVWDVQRRLLLWRGRLAYPAGNDYPRYCWGLLYLLPVLVFAQHELADPVARWAEMRLAELLMREQEQNGDGSFCAQRLGAWRQCIERQAGLRPTRPAASVYYRTQVDTAYYLALAYWWHRRGGEVEPPDDDQVAEELAEPFVERDCGVVFHRGRHRFASWSWNAHGAGVQGLVIPEDGDHLAEWEGNLVSRFYVRHASTDRRVLAHHEYVFPGGLATCGSLATAEDQIVHTVAFAALPDGRTTIFLTHALAVRPAELIGQEGMCLNVANDVFNENRRVLYSQDGQVDLPGVGAESQELTLNGPWLNVDGMLGIVELDHHEHFTVLVDGERRACGRSLCYSKICHPRTRRARQLAEGSVVEDAVVVFLCGLGPEETSRWPAWNVGPCTNERSARACAVRGLDDVWYIMAANCADHPVQIPLALTMEAGGFRMLIGHPEQFVLVGDAVVLSLDPRSMLLTALAVGDR